MNQHEISGCEVCGSKNLPTVLNLGLHPLCDDLVEIGSNRVCHEYKIEILYCNNCFTAHQKYQVPKQDLFPRSYHYRARFTADVVNGMKELVQDVEACFGDLTGKKVLDVGCNDGSLLNFFKEKGGKTYGMEPTDAFKDAIEGGHTIVNDYFSLSSANAMQKTSGKMDIITFTNVFAHIEDLNDVIAGLKALMHEKTAIVIENHYLGAVLEKNQFDTFYHEHPRTYSYHSFVHIAKSLGTRILKVEFPERYGGNIRVYMGDPSTYKGAAFSGEQVLKKEEKYFSRFGEMNSKIDSWKILMSQKINDANKKYGKLEAKAFPARAAILVKLLGFTDKEFLCVYEKPGSMKIGHYLPGTRIPIVSDDELIPKIGEQKFLVNFAWHIGKEIEGYLRKIGFKGELLNILDSN